MQFPLIICFLNGLGIYWFNNFTQQEIQPILNYEIEVKYARSCLQCQLSTAYFLPTITSIHPALRLEKFPPFLFSFQTGKHRTSQTWRAFQRTQGANLWGEDRTFNRSTSKTRSVLEMLLFFLWLRAKVKISVALRSSLFPARSRDRCASISLDFASDPKALLACKFSREGDGGFHDRIYLLSCPNASSRSAAVELCTCCGPGRTGTGSSSMGEEVGSRNASSFFQLNAFQSRQREAVWGWGGGGGIQHIRKVPGWGSLWHAIDPHCLNYHTDSVSEGNNSPP